MPGRGIYQIAFCLAVLLGLQSLAVQAADVSRETWGSTYDRPAVEVGGWFSDDGSSGEINVLVPLIFSEGNNLLFLGADFKMSEFDPNDFGDTVFNAGAYLGYRATLDDGNGVVGFWAGLDQMRTDDANDFTRAIAGIEYYGPMIIGRASAFMPLDSTSDEWSVTTGGFTSTYDEKIPSGFDIEVGVRMPIAAASMARPGEFRIFAGGYDYFDLDDDGGDVAGGRARLELDIYPFDSAPNTRLSFAAGYAYDKFSKDQFSAGVTLSIPLGVTNKITSHGAKDEVITAVDFYGQDLFQPVRRNREMVSRVRLKSRAPAGTGGAGGVGGFTLSTVCGGDNGELTLNSGLASSTIRRGSVLGVIDPAGDARPLKLNLAEMVSPDGRTLKQMLASEPAFINTTLRFTKTTVNFATQTVRPDAAIALSSAEFSAQVVRGAIVSVDGNSCSLNLDVRATAVKPPEPPIDPPPPPPQGLSLNTVCGGNAATISLVSASGVLASSTVTQGQVLGAIQPSGTPLMLDLAGMVAPDGETLATKLAGNPATLVSTFKFPDSTVNFGSQVVRPDTLVALSSAGSAVQSIREVSLSVNSTVCELTMNVVASHCMRWSGRRHSHRSLLCGSPAQQGHNPARGCCWQFCAQRTGLDL
jgi:hypothetical protein